MYQLAQEKRVRISFREETATSYKKSHAAGMGEKAETFLLTKSPPTGVSGPSDLKNQPQSSVTPWYSGFTAAQAAHLLLTLGSFFALNEKTQF